MKDFLGNELKVGDRIAVAVVWDYDDPSHLEVCSIVNFGKDRYGENAVIVRFSNNENTFEFYEPQIIKL